MKNREKTGSMSLLFDHYGLSTPLTPEARQRMEKDYDKIYDKVIKKASGTTLFTAVMTWMFFMLKKAGIPVSIAKFATAAVLVSSVGAGMYVSLNKPGVIPIPAVSAAKYTVMIRPFASRCA